MRGFGRMWRCLLELEDRLQIMTGKAEEEDVERGNAEDGPEDRPECER